MVARTLARFQELTLIIPNILELQAFFWPWEVPFLKGSWVWAPLETMQAVIVHTKYAVFAFSPAFWKMYTFFIQATSLYSTRAQALEKCSNFRGAEITCCFKIVLIMLFPLFSGQVLQKLMVYQAILRLNV